MDTPTAPPKNAFTALRGFSRRRLPEEQCELCGLPLAREHTHVLQVTGSQILCACDPCAILFTHRGEERKFVRIPRDIVRLTKFQITDGQWMALRLPIDMAFFLNSTAAGRVVAYYPSPAGTTESLLSLEAWTDLVAENPLLGKMAPDVEALLVNRTRGHRDYYIAPLDECYKLTGLIRIHWRGLSGGDAVWSEMEAFFASLKERAREEALYA